MKDGKTLKEQTVLGVVWKFGERMVAQVVSFVVSIILARMLMPEAYGLVALVMVFITLCDKLVISGFATSLIQKKDADNLDFSSVFYFSLTLSVLSYCALFFGAPWIAGFFENYNQPLLTVVIRVMGLRVILMAINSVQHAYVSRTMQFRRFFWSTLWGTLLSAVVGIGMAFAGAGVWALVAQYIVNSLTDTAVLWFTVRWRPGLQFSCARLKVLYSYGWKLFVASLLKTFYSNFRSLLIGKMYSSADLAFYNKGNSFPQLIESNVEGPIDSVLFSAIAKKQSSPEDVLRILRRAIKTSSYILMPMLLGLAAVAEPMVRLLLTETWLPCVPFVQILSISYLFSPVELENLQAIKAIGRSDIVLKLEILKKTVGILLTVFAIPFGVTAIAVSMVASALFAAIVNGISNWGLIGYTLRMQIEDILPSLLLSAGMLVVVWPLAGLQLPLLFVLIVQVLVGAGYYILFSAVLKVDSFRYLLNVMKNMWRRGSN